MAVSTPQSCAKTSSSNPSPKHERIARFELDNVAVFNFTETNAWYTCQNMCRAIKCR